MPSLFLPVKIGPQRLEQSFVGGVLGANNPTRLLLEEALMIFGKERRVAHILNIGCGLPRVLSVNPSDVTGAHRLLKETAADCEMVAHELSTRLFNSDVYFRLNVERGMEDIGMEDWNGLGAIESHTSAYIATIAVSKVIDKSLRRLRERVATATLSQISECIHFV